MASISVLLMPSGKWRALVRHPGRRPACRTHATKAAANAWARPIAAAFEAGGVPDGAVITVASLVDTYRKLRDGVRPVSDSSTEHYTLKCLTRLLGAKNAQSLSVDDLLAFAAERRDEGAGPYTVNMDLSKLSTVLRYAGTSSARTCCSMALACSAVSRFVPVGQLVMWLGGLK